MLVAGLADPSKPSRTMNPASRPVRIVARAQAPQTARPFRAESLPPGMRTTAFRRSSTRGASMPPGWAQSGSTPRITAPQGVQPRGRAETALQQLEIQLRQTLQVTFTS